MSVVSWLAEQSLDALRPALVELLPVAEHRRMRLRAGWIDHPDPAWWRASAVVEDSWVVKFCWSGPAAYKLMREVALHRALSGFGSLRLPPVVASSLDPVLLVTEFRPGETLSPDGVAVAAEVATTTLAGELAEVLDAFHSAQVSRLVTEAGMSLPEPVPQADTETLRSRFAPLVEGRRRDLVMSWCDWTDEVLRHGVEQQVVVHGDLHGSNLLVDDEGHVLHVVDLEEMATGDYHYDFRYLPAHHPSVDLHLQVAARYSALTGREVSSRRVMAWHIRTVLGDALWRTEAEVALPDNRTIDRWIDDIDDRLARLDIRVR